MAKKSRAEAKPPVKSAGENQSVSRRSAGTVKVSASDAELLDRVKALLDTGDDNLSLQVSRSHFHAGPLPPPDLLQEYANIIPDGANRIVEGWESEMTHRRTIEVRGQTIAAALAVMAIVASVATAYLGQPLVASSIIVATMLGIGLTGALGIFLSNR
jgi:uncharacterized membrane protein